MYIKMKQITIHKIHKTIVFYTRLGFSMLISIFVFESIRVIKNSYREREHFCHYIRGYIDKHHRDTCLLAVVCLWLCCDICPCPVRWGKLLDHQGSNLVQEFDNIKWRNEMSLQLSSIINFHIIHFLGNSFVLEPADLCS